MNLTSLIVLKHGGGIFFYITNKSNNSLFTEKPRGKELPK
jgi:hypothetical protein